MSDAVARCIFCGWFCCLDEMDDSAVVLLLLGRNGMLECKQRGEGELEERK